MTYVLTHASSIRGKSTDELLFDEAQDFDPELEIEVAQTQAASANPITIYAGTSLTTDTLLEKKWNDFVAPPVASNRKRYLPVTPSLKPFRSAKRGSFAPTIKADFRLNKTGP